MYLTEMFKTGRPAQEVVESMGGSQVSNEDEIRKFAQQAIASGAKQFEQYRSGKTGLFGFFVGQVMKLSGGRANPQVVNKVLKELLDA